MSDRSNKSLAEHKMGEVDQANLFEAPSIPEQQRMVEAILFASSTPVTVAELKNRMPQGSDPVFALDELKVQYSSRGVNLVKVGDGWAMRTSADLSFLMRKETIETRKLSRAAVETLAIIAYHQPVTRLEIEEVRGVGVSKGTVDLLLEMDWIKFGRRKMTPGRPVTFVVTQHFLDHFGLESAKDLPGLKELKSAGLLESTIPNVKETGEGLDNEEQDLSENLDQPELFEE
ncbi:MAG: SMC-Scp complex subunit ScpB [Marinovum sp.]|nr:SMC-Scp complex subunit ScpB [Marinovum sp.]GIR44431.1 MAG: segregation and condensation protein B [Paracoccaceae bacterium]|tara:strand:+ start:737 stop:1429 length:693 start_codon:yes stop_codon:yes gene_type:complete